jgi:hypothetical protein
MSSPEIYKIEYPAIPSAGLYYFNTDKGLRYEVRFGRLENNLLHANIVFGVVNDEYEEEYVVTNKGDVFKVMNTISEIIRDFIRLHPRWMCMNLMPYPEMKKKKNPENQILE